MEDPPMRSVRADNRPAETSRPTRRTILALGATGFLLAVSGGLGTTALFGRKEEALDLSTVVIKNPAFPKYPTSSGAVVMTRTAEGKEIAYQMDARGEQVFDLTVNVREYHQGKRRTLAEILAAVQKQYPKDDVVQQKEDFLRFVRAALANSVLITERQTVWSVYVET